LGITRLMCFGLFLAILTLYVKTIRGEPWSEQAGKRKLLDAKYNNQ
jgi:hypothetical protein